MYIQSGRRPATKVTMTKSRRGDSIPSPLLVKTMHIAEHVAFLLRREIGEDKMFPTHFFTREAAFLQHVR
jgi:hypothetical protein